MLAYVDPIDQVIRTWAEHSGFPVDTLMRLLVAALAGGLVGLEREVRGRQAGFRTNLLVCLGSALVMIVSITFAEHPWTHGAQYNVTVDPARIAYGVMQGIGFLGAGAIIKYGTNVRGLTTAAGLWCVAALGLSAGFGLYVITFLATGLVVSALWLLDYVEDILPRLRHRYVTIRRQWGPGCVAETVQRFREAGLDVNDASFERADNLTQVDITLQIAFVNSRQYYALERQLQSHADLELLSATES